MRGAAAVWVKTPGLSPVKTRLARGIGAEQAERFYELSAAAVGAVVRAAAERAGGRLVPVWAVAEADSHAWGGSEVVRQGEGGLGERLSNVYDALLQRFQFVLFLGADSPQIAPDALVRAAELAARGEFVFGPADDGGFYLFGGSRPIPRRVWLDAPYSSPDTLRALSAGLRALGEVSELEPLLDVDTEAELAGLRSSLRARRDLLPEQEELARWLDQRAGAPAES